MRSSTCATGTPRCRLCKSTVPASSSWPPCHTLLLPSSLLPRPPNISLRLVLRTVCSLHPPCRCTMHTNPPRSAFLHPRLYQAQLYIPLLSTCHNPLPMVLLSHKVNRQIYQTRIRQRTVSPLRAPSECTQVHSTLHHPIIMRQVYRGRGMCSTAVGP